jgi:hypothetical protein
VLKRIVQQASTGVIIITVRKKFTSQGENAMGEKKFDFEESTQLVTSEDWADELLSRVARDSSDGKVGNATIDELISFVRADGGPKEWIEAVCAELENAKEKA